MHDGHWVMTLSLLALACGTFKQEGHDGPGSLTTIEFYIFVPLVPTCDPQGGASFDSKGII